MRITVNGEEKEFPDGLTVLGLLENLGVMQGRVAVERNEQIVKRADHAATVIVDGDRIEIVSFMGGGC
ncbi:MAG: sulfur carrier protein ThiS [Nitrospirota bacterium]|nr:sulfur carrier protein ThiS [Nitrospirota bacterium]